MEQREKVERSAENFKHSLIMKYGKHHSCCVPIVITSALLRIFSEKQKDSAK
jgi:hypothetical protein